MDRSENLRWSARTRNMEDLLARARAGKKPLGLCVSFDCPPLIELGGRLGFDWVQINMEHTLISGLNSLVPLIRACELLGLVPIVKPSDFHPTEFRDALDAGAYGLVLPFSETAKQVQEMVEHCRFPPYGTRGYCSFQRTTWYGSNLSSGNAKDTVDFLKFQNEHTLLIPTIESVKGVENINELLTIPNMPVFHIGPNDLARAYNLNEANPDDLLYLNTIVKDISRKCHAAGKMVTIPTKMPAGGQEANLHFLNELGNDLPYASDTNMVVFSMLQALKIRDAVIAKPVETSQVATQSASVPNIETTKRVTSGNNRHAQVLSELAPHGKLRVGLLLSNPVLVNKNKDPNGGWTGVSIDIGRELARRLEVPYEAVGHQEVADLANSFGQGTWDVGFLAFAPARLTIMDFARHYMDVENTYLVPAGSKIQKLEDVDQTGVRIGVPAKGGPDLYLTTKIEQADLIRGAGGDDTVVELLSKGGVDVFAENRHLLTTAQKRLPGSRVLKDNFYEVPQSLGVPKGTTAGIAYCREFLEELKSSGFIQQAIDRHGIVGVRVAALGPAPGTAENPVAIPTNTLSCLC